MPRIITPSSTAWPPTGASRVATSSDSAPPAPTAFSGELRAGGRACAAPTLGDSPLEALDPAAGVDQLLLAGVERMAGGADFDVDFRLGRPRRELVPAGAADVSFD